MKCLIYSVEHKGFWKSNHRGYTNIRSEAGIYSLEEATKICLNANQYLQKGHLFEESMIPLPDLEI